MNYQKANMEVCKGLANGEIVRGCWFDDLLFVTVNGMYGFYIPKKEIVFDVSKVKMTSKTDTFTPDNYLKRGVEIKPTNHYFCMNSKYYRRFDGEEYNVFVQQKFLGSLGKDNYKYFQRISPGKHMNKEPIVAAHEFYEPGSTESNLIPIMVFCPMIILDYEK